MKKITLLICFISSLGLIAQHNILENESAHNFFEGADLVRIEEGSKAPSFVRFNSEAELTESAFFLRLKNELQMNVNYSFQLKTTTVDQLGITHNRYFQLYNGREVAYSNLMIHIRDGRVLSYNGVYQVDAPERNSINMSEEQALKLALDFVGATEYRWQIEGGAEISKNEYYPKAELVYIPNYYKDDIPSISLTYRFNVYATEPLSRQYIFVDAQDGSIPFHESQMHTGGHSHGRAVTGYSDTQNIITDSVGSFFRLRDSTRGLGVETYDCQRTRNFSAAVDFIDSNNFWNNFNPNLDQYAGDCHWATEVFYDYLSLVHNRNSIDDSGFTLKSYIHYDQNLVNAFWDGQRMTYGDGNNMTSPLTTIDIVGHEITHGLTDFTSDLIYANESGALNESFSDIFGSVLEFYARPSNANWQIGEDIGGAFRSMISPKNNGDPDTYGGINWIDQNCIPTSSNDRCGVHTNSGVQNHWFYLLADGGIGVNDNSDSFNVVGQGRLKAEMIAYRNLTIYLSPSSNHDDARFFGILSAIDLYGACSPEVESTTNAWQAVGIGDPYVNAVTADFDAIEDNIFCFFPVTVNFNSTGSNVSGFKWDFGNGDTSLARNPTVTYNAPGKYSVQLVADGSTCGADTIVKTDYISVNPNNTCSYLLRDTVNQTITDCAGRLYDSGGFGGDYGSGENSTITIHVASADFIQLDFIKLAVEAGLGFNCNRDYIEVFDGPTIDDPVLGRYCSNFLPPNLRVTSSSNYVTIRLHTDNAGNDEGFRIDWLCRNAVGNPVADFSVNTDSTCDGQVAFRNLSSGGIDNIFWDFGDGSTSNDIHPEHTYRTNGIYDVRLTVQNSRGVDTLTKTNIVTVNRPLPPAVSNDTFCIGADAGLKINTAGRIEWYQDTTQNFVLVADSLTLFNLTQDTSFYVREVTNPPIVSGGPLNNIGAGGFSADNDYILFDAHKRVILRTLVLFSNRAGIRRLDLWNNQGDLVNTTNIYIPASPLRVNINMVIEPDSNYRLAFSDRDVSLYKNTAGAAYPYNVSNLITLKGSNNAGEFPYFYQWRVSELPCIGKFAEIKAVVDTSCSVVGINEIADQSSMVEINPNPFQNQLQLNFSADIEDQSVQILITNTNGALVQEGLIATQKGTVNLDLAELSNGVYYLTVIGDKTYLSKKLVKID